MAKFERCMKKVEVVTTFPIFLANMPFSFAPIEVRQEALVEFMDCAESFVEGYAEDGDVYITICNRIIFRLLANCDMDINTQGHPFLRYGNPNVDYQQSIHRLERDVLQFAQSQEERSITQSFFHVNGSQREALEEMFDAYIRFVDECIVIHNEDSDETATVYDDSEDNVMD